MSRDASFARPRKGDRPGQPGEGKISVKAHTLNGSRAKT
jgi:hypothetical protein